MDKETMNKVLEANNEIMDLKGVKKKINRNGKEFRLWYISRNSDQFMNIWDIVDTRLMEDIYDILDKHDKLIRQEIDEKICQLKKDLEKL